MLASYISHNYAMYALANHYNGANLVVPNYYVPSTPQYPIRPSLSAASMCSVPVPNEEVPECATNNRQTQYDYEGDEKQVEANSLNKPELKFSIERILSSNTSYSEREAEELSSTNQMDDDVAMKMDDAGLLKLSDDDMKYSWLQCTRYKPPKLQRIRKKDGGKKRKLGRNPRVPFTQYQVAALEQKFCQTHYLSSIDVAELSTALNLTETRVKIWFQNRRARERRDRDSELRNCPSLTQGETTSQALTFKSQTSALSSSWNLNIPTPHTSLSRLHKALHRSTTAFTAVPYSSCNSP